MPTVGRFSTRSLYLQVKDALIERILAGTWKPGAAIPNEVELSRELGISIGTLRKALDEMEAERLISRRQGRGTFVIDQTSEECAIRFSNIRDTEGNRIAGALESCEIIGATANETEARMLQLRGGDPVARLHRVLIHAGRPFMVEDSTIPQVCFPGLAQASNISSSIVALAQLYGHLLGHGKEKISAVVADRPDAAALKVRRGAPVLKLDRVVYAIDGRPIEWRVARCYLRDMHYITEIH